MPLTKSTMAFLAGPLFQLGSKSAGISDPLPRAEDEARADAAAVPCRPAPEIARVQQRRDRDALARLPDFPRCALLLSRAGRLVWSVSAMKSPPEQAPHRRPLRVPPT